MQRLKEYTPFLTGLLLIAFGLFVPLGFAGEPRLFDLLVSIF
ncbi:MAG TPA: hypothetical protein VFV52_11730 [Bacilli bacterium]|nr:hypothetical protein [Bacilli bacterium]